MSEYALTFLTLPYYFGIAGTSSAKMAAPYSNIPPTTRRSLQLDGVLVLTLSLVVIDILLFLTPVLR